MLLWSRGAFHQLTLGLLNVHAASFVTVRSETLQTTTSNPLIFEKHHHLEKNLTVVRRL